MRQTTSLGTLFIACVVSVIAWPQAGVAAAGSPVTISMQQFVTSDDNVSKSQSGDDRESDVFLQVSADISYTFSLSQLHALTLVGSFRDEEFSDFDGLSNTQYGGTLDYRFQTRASFTAPAYSIFVRKTEMDFETDIRDSSMSEYGASVARKLTNKITGALGIAQSRRSARGEVFDLERIRYFGNLDWQFTDRVAFYTNYSYIDGDVFSTATPTLELVTLAEDIEPDNAFGGIENSKFAYRLDAKTQILRIGMNVGIGSSASFDLSMDKLDSDAVGTLHYDLLSFTAGFLLQF